MAFLDQLRRGTQRIAEKSEELVGAAKIKYSLVKIETEITKHKAELGDLVYRIYKEGGLEHQEITSICEEINKLVEESEHLNLQLAELQPQTQNEICPHCGKNIT